MSTLGHAVPRHELLRGFLVNTTTRVIFLFGSLLGSALLMASDFLVAPGLMAIVAIVQLADLVRYVQRTNEELVRFLEAVRNQDFTQTFATDALGTGFERLGRVLTYLMEGFRSERAVQEQELRYLRATVDQVPVPLVAVESEGSLTALNHAARRLFGAVPVRRVDDLMAFGSELRDAVLYTPPGMRRLVPFDADGVPLRLALRANEIVVRGRRQRLISLQNIQSELDSQEIESWQKLVRVLTHEIGNSITPVASLAHSTEDLLSELSVHHPHLEDIDEARSAVQTVARRADGLIRFVRTYQQLKGLPSPRPQPLNLCDQFAAMKTLMQAEWQSRDVRLTTEVTPERLEVHADREQLDQVLINLLRNASEAVAHHASPQIWMKAYMSRRGRVVIEVLDNGPGVPEGLEERVFVPFFTTKSEGTGVGLALTRQIMMAHGGYVSLAQRDGGGARLSLIF
ncbi:MAG: PAS domain-containing sensor histidine kinase [Myxococcota bacterium]